MRSDARVEIPQTVWSVAQPFREEVARWLLTAKVQLDKDPTLNIGALHAQIAEVREHSNKVRDAYYNALDLKVALRNEAAGCETRYERALAGAQQAYAEVESFKKLKSREERELLLRVLIERTYLAKRETAERLEDWEQFLKQISAVMFSLNDTRKDIEAQIAVLRVQMFKGDLKPNPELKALNGLADLLGSDARSLLEGGRSPLEAESPEPPTTFTPPKGALQNWQIRAGEDMASGKYDDEVSFD